MESGEGTAWFGATGGTVMQRLRDFFRARYDPEADDLSKDLRAAAAAERARAERARVLRMRRIFLEDALLPHPVREEGREGRHGAGD